MSDTKKPAEAPALQIASQTGGRTGPTVFTPEAMAKLRGEDAPAKPAEAPAAAPAAAPSKERARGLEAIAAMRNATDDQRKDLLAKAGLKSEGVPGRTLEDAVSKPLSLATQMGVPDSPAEAPDGPEPLEATEPMEDIESLVTGVLDAQAPQVTPTVAMLRETYTQKGAQAALEAQGLTPGVAKALAYSAPQQEVLAVLDRGVLRPSQSSDQEAQAERGGLERAEAGDDPASGEAQVEAPSEGADRLARLLQEQGANSGDPQTQATLSLLLREVQGLKAPMMRERAKATKAELVGSYPELADAATWQGTIEPAVQRLMKGGVTADIGEALRLATVQAFGIRTAQATSYDPSQRQPALPVPAMTATEGPQLDAKARKTAIVRAIRGGADPGSILDYGKRTASLVNRR